VNVQIILDLLSEILTFIENLGLTVTTFLSDSRPNRYNQSESYKLKR